MTKKIFLSTLFLFLAFIQFSNAQGLTNLALGFKEIIYDFGTFKEENGEVNHEFIFENKSNKFIIISDVKASCGCTTPFWTKDTIQPGKSGIIKAVYDPHNRPGPFSKNLTVFAVNSAQPVILVIKGIVSPKPKSPADEYPDKMGALRMYSRYMYFGDVNTEKRITKEFEIYNESNKELSLVSTHILPYMTISLKPTIIKPNEKGKFVIEYEPSLKNDYGYLVDKVGIRMSDEPEVEKLVFVTGTVKPFFPIMSEIEKNEAPKIVFEKESYDFGVIKQGEKPATFFMFSNKGKKDLIIYKTKASCGCTATEPESKLLKPGETSKINVVFDTKDKDGNQEKQINIYCNDPSNPSPTLFIKALISK